MARQLAYGRGYIGRLGGTVGMYGKKRVPLVREYVKNVSNPQTTAQLRQRTRFLTATGLAAAMSDYLGGFSAVAQRERITIRNAFVSAALKAGHDGGQGVGWQRAIEANPVFGQVVATVDYKYLPISYGLPSTTTVSAAQQSRTIQADFEDASVGDALHVVLYNKTKALAAGVVAEATGATQAVVFNMPDTWEAGDEVAVWAYTRSFDDAGQLVRYMSYFTGGVAEAAADIEAISMLGTPSATIWVDEITLT